MKVLLALGVMVASQPAMAAPTYLLCTFAKGPVALDVIADEANGQVTTLVQSTGHMERRPAIFTPDEVKWSGSGSLGLSYSLSRVDLSLKRILTIGEKQFPDDAKCELKQAPKRAF